MKLKRTVHNRCMSLLICFSLFSSGLPTAVSCIGGDGHITIEAVGSECCKAVQVGISQKPLMASGVSGLTVSKGSCGSCVDIPIFIGLVDVFKKPEQVNPIFVAFSTISPAIINSYDSSECRSISEPLAVLNPCLASLRSTILLI